MLEIASSNCIPCWSGGVYPTIRTVHLCGPTNALWHTARTPTSMYNGSHVCPTVSTELAQLAELTGSPNPGWPSEINWFAQKLLCPKLWCSWSMTIEYYIYIHMLCWIIGFGCANFPHKPRHHRCEKNKKLKPRCLPGLSQSPGNIVCSTVLYTHTSIHNNKVLIHANSCKKSIESSMVTLVTQENHLISGERRRKVIQCLGHFQATVTWWWKKTSSFQFGVAMKWG